jgi:hypothetical protein
MYNIYTLYECFRQQVCKYLIIQDYKFLRLNLLIFEQNSLDLLLF